MAEKGTKLSIVIRTVDKATAVIRAINARIAKMAAPIHAVGAKMVGAFKTVGRAIAGVVSKVPLIGGVIAAVTAGAVAAVMSLVNRFDALGDAAENVGVSVDALAQLRYAAERSGVAVDELDRGMEGFAKSLGEARAGTGTLASFLGKVSPALLKQLKAAKGNEQAFDLMADAMAKVTDPAKRAILAQKAFGNAALAPLLARGSKGIAELRTRYLELAGSQEEAAAEAGKVDDAMVDLRASADGIKAALVTGLAPALKIVVDRLRDWFVSNRDDIKQWATEIGEKLPGAIRGAVAWVEKAVAKVMALVDGVNKVFEAGSRLRRKFLGPSVDELADEQYKRISAFSRDHEKKYGATPTSLRASAARGRQHAANLYHKRGGMTEQDEAMFNASMRLADDLTRRADEVQWGTGPRLDMEKFKGRYAMADPDRFEKYDAQFAEPIADAIVRSLASVTSQAKIAIDIGNAPRGTRVSTDPQSTADVDLSVGYQMLPGVP